MYEKTDKDKPVINGKTKLAMNIQKKLLELNELLEEAYQWNLIVDIRQDFISTPVRDNSRTILSASIYGKIG